MHPTHLNCKQKEVKVLVFWDVTLGNMIGTKLHGVTLQKTRIAIFTIMGTQNLIKEDDLRNVYLLSPQLTFFFPFSRWQYGIQNLFCLPAAVSSNLS
jgi:hypothetical protein